MPGKRDELECPAAWGRLKHATISFGQAMPVAELREAGRWSAEADIMLVVAFVAGSDSRSRSAVADPRGGGRLVIINRDPTPLDGGGIGGAVPNWGRLARDRSPVGVRIAG